MMRPCIRTDEISVTLGVVVRIAPQIGVEEEFWQIFFDFDTNERSNSKALEKWIATIPRGGDVPLSPVKVARS